MIETLHGFAIRNGKIVISVTSNGCTTAASFHLKVEHGTTGNLLTVERTVPDTCLMTAHTKDFEFPIPAGLGTAPFQLHNPFAKGPGQMNLVAPAAPAPEGWSAIHDFMPPGPGRLRVNGVLTMPTPGYRLTLTKAEPQGINPSILILTLHKEPPAGTVLQVLTPTPVAYLETTDVPYTEISIQPDGISVPVEDVH